ncbi:MAG TPA: hypothetical protein PKW42_06425 [bacterium]|nr:hypothetical protein [bacterium]HPP12353.1 hypothetical protein [bacterium]
MKPGELLLAAVLLSAFLFLAATCPGAEKKLQPSPAGAVVSPPALTREDCNNETSIAGFVHWFILYDSTVRVIGQKEANLLFESGYLPEVMVGDDPAHYSKKFRSLAEWFAIKILLDLQSLKKASQNGFAVFLSRLNRRAARALASAGETAARYGLTGNPFEARQMEKIPSGWRQDKFKKDLLEVNLLTAELKILGWVYHLWFGGWYGQSSPGNY